jgi:catechol 2,3-dioxygenase-like lactoylglutathione lyase family enzyme
MDQRPPLWIGHVTLWVRDAVASAAFWEGLGLRRVWVSEQIGVLELRGGTHLVLLPGQASPPGQGQFDLMVDDLDATHASWSQQGLPVGPLTRGSIHDSFELTDPDGYVVSVLSSHVAGPV